jgi:hypothetical protein
VRLELLAAKKEFTRQRDALTRSRMAMPWEQKVYRWAEIGGAKMEEGVTIAKVPDWMKLKPKMMRHLIREHEKLGRTLTEEETVTLLRSLGFEITEPK